MALAGKYLMVAGALLFLLGLALTLSGGKLGFLGKLPGDIRIEKENFNFYFPLTTCLLLSLIASLIFKLLSWLFGK